MLTEREMEQLFGPRKGLPISAYLRQSPSRFVRTKELLARAPFRKPGLELTAWEVWHSYDDETLLALARDGQVPLPDERLARLADQSERLGLEQPKASGATPWPLARMAQSVGLDERALFGSFGPTAAAQRLATRLKSQRANMQLSRSAVKALAEAAWVVARQQALRHALGNPSQPLAELGFTPDPQYSGMPPYEIGFQLARNTRELLGLEPEAPILRLRELVEVRLGIPVVQTELPRAIAGATVSSRSRGIVLNTTGANQNALVRRATLAHELGHLLWDPEDRLQALAVDRYDDLERGYGPRRNDPVEQRANAFAIELLAPQAGVRRLVEEHGLDGGVRAVMDTYGISLSATRHHVRNALELGPNAPIGKPGPEPSADWQGRESYTVDFFPLGAEVPLSRRGTLCAWVALASEHGLLSDDTARLHLGLEPSAPWTSAERATLLSLYPWVRATPQSEPQPAAQSVSAPASNNAWLRANARQHAGHLVALRDGELIASVRTVSELRQALEAKRLTLRQVTVVPIGSFDNAAA